MSMSAVLADAPSVAEWLSASMFDEEASSPAPPHTDESPRAELSQMISVLRSVGIEVQHGRDGYPCPRHDRGPACTSFWFDCESLVFTCFGCHLRGRGLRSLLAVRDILDVPMSEREPYEFFYADMGHCPDSKRPLFIKGDRARLEIWPCRRGSCGYCGFRRWRAQYGHFGVRLKHGSCFIHTLDQRQWDAFRKQVGRLRGHYVRCPQPDGTIKVFTDIAVRADDFEFTDLCERDSLGYMVVWWDLACALQATCTAEGSVSSSRDWCIERRTQELAQDLDLTRDEERNGWKQAVYNGTNWFDLVHSAAEFDLLSASTASSVRQRYDIAGSAKQFETWLDKHQIVLVSDLAEMAEDFHEAHSWAGPQGVTP